MQVSVETTGTVGRSLTIVVPKEHIEPKIQNRLKSLASETKFNGFRPGKVPKRVVEQRYGQKVRQEILAEVLQTSFSEALTQEKLRPAGEASFDLKTDIEKLEQGLSYIATFEIYPEIATLNVDELPIEKPVAQITEADVDTMMSRLRQQRQTWEDVDRPAQQDDRVIIDFVGTINGKSFKGNEVKQLPVIIGQKDFVLPGLEEKLLGLSAGDEREFDLSFPKEHKNPQLAGQTVHFVINVSKVARPQLPEMDADFIKSFGVENGTVDMLRVEARRNMEMELKYSADGQIKQQILDGLLNANPIEVPQVLIEEESQRLLKSQQQEWPNSELSAEMFKDEALKRVKMWILIHELVNRHKIQAPSNKVQQLIERIAYGYEDPDAVVKEYYADEQRLKEAESIVLEDEVVSWLLKRAKITEKPSSFYQIVENNQEQLHKKQVV